MISARKLKTNRANARASTGPKTACGKARSSQNARRHGLSLSISVIPYLSDDAEILAREIAGEAARSEITDGARRFAETQINLVRVQRARHDLFLANLPFRTMHLEYRVPG